MGVGATLMTCAIVLRITQIRLAVQVALCIASSAGAVPPFQTYFHRGRVSPGGIFCAGGAGCSTAVSK